MRSHVLWISLAACLALGCGGDEASVDGGGLQRPDGSPVWPDGCLPASCDADRVAPSIPTGPTAAYEEGAVQVRWEPSTDAVGVAGYVVFRDGAELATVAEPSYRDTEALVPSSTHVYWITAFDEAGNASHRSDGAAVAIPAAEAGLDDGVDDDGDGWLETSFGFRIRAAHPRVICTPEHLSEVLARMHGPEARDPWRRWFELIRSEADAGADVGSLARALLYRATGEEAYLASIIERLSDRVPSRDELYALDLVYDDVPEAVLRALQARIAGERDVFHYASARDAERGEASWGYHSSPGVAYALAYAGVMALSAVELDDAAPADRFDTLGYLRAVHEELSPEGQLWRLENRIAGDPTFNQDALPGEPGGMYDNLGYDGSEESRSIYMLHGWHTLTGQARYRGALHDEHRARFWHAMRSPSSEVVHEGDGYCRHAGGRSGTVVEIWNTRSSRDQPPAPAAALAAWLYRDPLMQDFVVNGQDLEKCSAPHGSLAWWLLFRDESLDVRTPDTLPDAHYFSGPGIVTSRAGWTPNVTYAVFAAGDGISRRYEDAGSFILHRHGPVVVHAGARIRFEPDNDRHHWFHIRSASKNTLRVYDPAEVFDDDGRRNPPWMLVPSDNLGGQLFETHYAREDLTYPISSGGVRGRSADPDAPLDVVDVANVLRYEAALDAYVYALADASPAYGPKVERFERAFVHARPDVLLLFDRLRTADTSFQRVWTAHTVARPVSSAVVERGFGVVDYGAEEVLTLEDGEDGGRVHVLAPAERELRVRGGETVLHTAPLRSGEDWTEPVAVEAPRWFEILAAGTDVEGTLTIVGEDASGATVEEEVELGEVVRAYERGTPTQVRAGEVQVDGAGWEPGQWAGYMLELQGGRRALIVDNDADTLLADVSGGSSWYYEIGRALGNTRTRFARVTGVRSTSLDLEVLELVVPHHFDTPDALGRVHSFSPHTDGRHDAFYGNPALGRYTIELEAVGSAPDTNFFVAFALSDPGTEPPSVEGRRGDGLHAAVVDRAVAYVFIDAREADAGRVALPTGVTTAHVFGLRPGAHYEVSLTSELSIRPSEGGAWCASPQGTLTLRR